MFTCLNFAPSARRAATVCAENPHCGKSGVPFMNRTTGAELSSALIRVTTSDCSTAASICRCLVKLLLHGDQVLHRLHALHGARIGTSIVSLADVSHLTPQ